MPRTVVKAQFCPPIKVAAILDTWQVSGPGRQLVASARALARHGVDLRIFMFQRTGKPPSPFAGFLAASHVQYLVLPDNGRASISAFRQLRDALRTWNPDIIQSHGYRPNCFAYVFRRLGGNQPWLAFFHGATAENWKVRLYHQLDRRLLLPSADIAVVMSERDKRSFAHLREQVRVVYNACVDLPPSTSPLPLARRDGSPVIGAVSRLSYEKGLDVLLDALALLHSAGVPAQLSIAGDGPEQRTLERQACALNLREHVRFLGHVQPSTLYSQVDVVVIPSRTEGLPNVLLEALHANVPVVATAVGAIPEVLIESAAGFMVPPEDAHSLAAAITRTLECRAEDAEPSARARRRASQRFSLENRVAAIVKLYAELLPNRARST